MQSNVAILPSCYKTPAIWVEGHCIDGPEMAPHAPQLIAINLHPKATSQQCCLNSGDVLREDIV